MAKSWDLAVWRSGAGRARMVGAVPPSAASWSVPAIARRLPAGPTLFCAALLVAGVLAAPLLPAGPYLYGPGLARHLLDWDALWYQGIARHGYAWDPAVAAMPQGFQSVAFYPLYPLLIRALCMLTGAGSAGVMLAVGLVSGLASIPAFDRLARRIRPDAAPLAVWLYAAWPAACFFAMGYPTGLMNLLAIAALDAHARGRVWQAATLCGLAGATGPLLVIMAGALWLDRALLWWCSDRGRRGFARLIGAGALSASGQIGFCLFLLWRFGDPLAFIEAQKAWPGSPSLPVHLLRLVDPLWYLMPFDQLAQALHELPRLGLAAADRGSRTAIALATDRLLNMFCLLLAAIGLLNGVRRLPRFVLLPSAAILLAYLWLIGTSDQMFVDTPRLLFPALGIFLGLGIPAGERRWPAAALVALLGLLTVVNVALAARGYVVI